MRRGVNNMYRSNHQQAEFEEIYLPFGGKLKSDNRWVKLAKQIPWSKIEKLYEQKLSETGMGAPAKSARIALGALIIKERLGSSDEETVEQICENPFLQYFLGYHEYSNQAPFEASMLVHFRKRLSLKLLEEINEEIIPRELLSREKKSEDEAKHNKDDEEPPGNQGKMIIDTTCTPADITYPTDLKLLNRAREKSEEIIDSLYEPIKEEVAKPRTYRKKARRKYLALAKRKQVRMQIRRKGLRQQLGYLRRNIGHIKSLAQIKGLEALSNRHYKNLLVIHEVYRQQQELYQSRQCRISDRIVSISQPHIRPIVRGKAGTKVEFGAKISVSLVSGYVNVDRISWDSFHDAEELKKQAEKYHRRYGYYPESIHADGIYRTRENRMYCKLKGIRLSGPPLGRRSKKKLESQAGRQLAHQDELDRIPIEGKFGQAKRRYSLKRVMTKLAGTSESAIAIAFLVINLDKWMETLFFYFLKSRCAVEDLFDSIILFLSSPNRHEIQM